MLHARPGKVGWQGSLRGEARIGVRPFGHFVVCYALKCRRGNGGGGEFMQIGYTVEQKTKEPKERARKRTSEREQGRQR